MIIPLRSLRPTLSNWPTQPQPGDLLWDPNEQAVTGVYAGNTFHELDAITDLRTRYLWSYHPARVLIAMVQLHSAPPVHVFVHLAPTCPLSPEFGGWETFDQRGQLRATIGAAVLAKLASNPATAP